MKSKVVLVLWCINLCSKLVASIPLQEDLARHLVGAQQDSGPPTFHVLEKNNAHSQIQNPVGLVQSYDPELREDLLPHPLRENKFRVTPQDINAPARYKKLPMPYREGSIRPEVPFNQEPRQFQVPQNQQYVGSPLDPSIEQLHAWHPIEIEQQQRPFGKTLVEDQSNRLSLTKEQNEWPNVKFNHQIPIRQALPNIESIRQPLQPSNLRPKHPLRVSVEPSNQQLINQHLVQNNGPPLPNEQFLNTRSLNDISSKQELPRTHLTALNPTQPFKRHFLGPAEVLQSHQPLAQPANNQLLNRPPPPPELNVHQFAIQNELKKAAIGALRPKKRYTVVFPDGRVDYVDQLESITNMFPNYTMMNGYDAIAASNVAAVNHPIQKPNIVVPRQPNKSLYATNAEAQTSVINNKERKENVKQFPNFELQTKSIEPQIEKETVRAETTITSFSPQKLIGQVLAPHAITLRPETESISEGVPANFVESSLVNSDKEKELNIVPTSYAEKPQSENQSQIQRNLNDIQYNQAIKSQYPIQKKSKPDQLPSQSEAQSQSEGQSQSGTQTQSEEQNQNETNSQNGAQLQNGVQMQNETNSHSGAQSQSKEKSQLDSKDEDVVVQNEILYTTVKSQFENQNESTSFPEQSSDTTSNEQNQTQNNQEGSQVTSENNTETSTASSHSYSSVAPETATECESHWEEIDNEENPKTIATAPSENSTSSETHSQSDSQSSNTELNDEDSERGQPYTWFSSEDPDFLNKLLGKDKVFGVVYFFMVPSDAPYYD